MHSTTVETPHTRTMASLTEVMAYENPDVINRYREKMGLSAEEAQELFSDTKKFLYLCGTVPGCWRPPVQVDEGWHQFILFTRDYQDFCRQWFGRVIHHEPRRVTRSSVGSSVSETIAMARELFGDNLSRNWTSGRNSAECSKSGCNCSPDTGGGGSECSPN